MVAIDWDSPVSAEKYALVLMGDRVACFESTTAADAKWKVTLINGDPWVSLSSHSAQSAGSVLKQLSERRNLLKQLAQVHITLIYEHAAVRHLVDVSRALTELQCSSWEVLRYEPLVERIMLSHGDVPRPNDGAWLAEFGMYAGCKFVLGQAVLQAVLRGDACDEARLRIRQVVGRGLAQQVDGLANGVEVGIGAYGSKLRGAVGARVGAKGFVIVPEKGVRGVGAGVGRIHAGDYGLIRG